MLQNMHHCFSVNKGYYFFGYTGSSAIEQVDLYYEGINLSMIKSKSGGRNRNDDWVEGIHLEERSTGQHHAPC